MPLTPGYHGDDQEPDYCCGGGGAHRLSGADQGQRRRRRQGHAARRRAPRTSRRRSPAASARRAPSFGDDRVLVEKYLLAAAAHRGAGVRRHATATCVHLFERDCSVQRRHQKVIEEAPAPGMTPRAPRARWARRPSRPRAPSATSAPARSSSSSAPDGDVLLHGDEHAPAGRASGHRDDHRPRPRGVAAARRRRASRCRCTQDELAIRGHAIEARIYAEDPARGFLPSTGTLAHLAMPPPVGAACASTPACAQGDAITPYYDPMIAKLIVHGDESRDRCACAPAQALAQYRIVGVREQRRVPGAPGRIARRSRAPISTRR